MDEVVNHLIDMTIPDADWKGYWCPEDEEYHKDGMIIFFNPHCITCGVILDEVFPTVIDDGPT